ncbi:MAG: hypothetical protein AAGK17_09450 [Pseudomonadota bacterium]
MKQVMSQDYLRSTDGNYDGPEPMAYRLHADAFLQCAEFAIFGIRQSGQDEPNMMQNAPIVHLICHSVEMFLKLALYKTGSDEKDLRAFKLRHNLTNLKGKCVAHGVTFSEDVAALIDTLSPLHEKHKLRYSAFIEQPIWLPYGPSEMVEITRKLIGASHPSQTA